ncbi:MAG: hypothetical protein ACLQT6_00765 [Desulfomonilaceae bacterium]
MVFLYSPTKPGSDLSSLFDSSTKAMVRRFAFKGFHKGVMKLLRNDMGSTRFIKWAVNGTEVPPSWEDAMRRFGNS